MRASRAKLAAPPFYPVRKEKPVFDRVKGVPVELAFAVAEYVLKHGEQPIYFGKLGDEASAIQIGPVKFEAVINEVDGLHYGRYWHSIGLSSEGWSCELRLQHWPMGGVECHRFYGKMYTVISYKMENKTGWLRDMTFAQMFSDEWKK